MTERMAYSGQLTLTDDTGCHLAHPRDLRFVVSKDSPEISFEVHAMVIAVKSAPTATLSLMVAGVPWIQQLFVGVERGQGFSFEVIRFRVSIQ